MTPTWTARPASSGRYPFAEGARSDGEHLLWVDLLAGRLHRAPLDDLDAVETLVDLDEPLGAFAPCTEGGFLLARGRGLAHLDDAGAVTPLLALEPEGSRMNDAGCDPQGRFWAGSMAYDESEGAGSLYRVDLQGRVDRVRRGVTVGNGPAFSPDGGTLYLDDSGRGTTSALDVDDPAGPERVLVRHERGAGDGLAVDDEGCLWVALFGGAAVHRYAPDGRLLGRVEVAASQVSSCCLARGRLYVTTVAEGLDAPEEHAGRLLVADVGVGGPAVAPYRGPLRLTTGASSG